MKLGGKPGRFAGRDAIEKYPAFIRKLIFLITAPIRNLHEYHPRRTSNDSLGINRK